MAPLVYLFATLLLIGSGRIPRTLVVLAALLAACIAAGVVIATSASITAGSTEMVTVVAYGLFAVGILTAGVVDVVERRIPNRITYPLLAFGVLGLPWLAFPITGWMLLGPLIGAVISGCIGMLNAVFADQGLGDVKLAAVIGAWMAHLGLLPWITGMMLGQLLMIVAIAGNQLRRRWAGLPRDHTPLAPSLAGGAILAVAAAGLAF
jgi:leader peptidase (prepilin peptidase)/N-methyltransferase